MKKVLIIFAALIIVFGAVFAYLKLFKGEKKASISDINTNIVEEAVDKADLGQASSLEPPASQSPVSEVPVVSSTSVAIITEPIKPSDSSSIAKVAIPVADSIVRSPLMVGGQAKDSLFDKGSFQIDLADASGKIIATGQALAQGDSSKPGFVPFFAQITFDKGAAKTGWLIINTNNSGPAADAKELKIPVRFE